MTDRTLVLCKPDAVERKLVGEIIRRLEAKDLTIVALELRTLEVDVAQVALRRARRQAVLRRPRRVHHPEPARGDGRRGPGRAAGRPHADGGRPTRVRPRRARSAATWRSSSPRTWSTAPIRPNRRLARSHSSSPVSPERRVTACARGGRRAGSRTLATPTLVPSGPPREASPVSEPWYSSIVGRDMAVDLGTANTLVYVRGRGIVLERALGRRDQREGRPPARGRRRGEADDRPHARATSRRSGRSRTA